MSLKHFIAWAAVAVAAAVGCAVRAHADPIDSSVVMYAAKNSGGVCSTLAVYPTFEGVTGVMEGITEDGFTVNQAAQAVIIAVESRCPQRLPLLQAFADSVPQKAVSAV